MHFLNYKNLRTHQYSVLLAGLPAGQRPVLQLLRGQFLASVSLRSHYHIFLQWKQWIKSYWKHDVWRRKSL